MLMSILIRLYNISFHNNNEHIKMVTKELSYILQLKFQHNISYDTVRKRKIDYNGTKIDQKVIKPFSIVNRNMN